MTGFSHILAALDAHADAIALESGGAALRYGELRGEVETLARKLEGARTVAISLANGIPWIVADLACVQAGVACIPLPPFFIPAQREHAMRDAGVSLVLTDQPEQFEGEFESMDVAGQRIALIRQTYAPVPLPPRTAKITYTSGTTGAPKGVCLTQEAMETVAQSLLSVLGEDIARRHVCLLPLAILLENVAGVYTSLLAGATCCLPPVRHEPQALAQAIASSGASSCILVPELLRMVMAAGRPLPHLAFAAVGGARVDPSLLDAAHAMGIPAYEGYGISENASVLTVNTPSAFQHGSAGKPLPHVQLQIDEAGEIWVKNPLFSGYLGDAAPTGEWYATGDIGAWDADGFLHIQGRKRHIFITSFGRNVSPEWPESILTSHPAITQAMVYGEAQPFPVAVILPRDAASVPAAIAYANARLPDYAQIGGYVLAREPFTPQNGQLTGNGRLRRDAIHTAYTQELTSLYSSKKEYSA